MGEDGVLLWVVGWREKLLCCRLELTSARGGEELVEVVDGERVKREVLGGREEEEREERKEERGE